MSSDLGFTRDEPQEAPERWSPRLWRAQIEPMVWHAGMFGDLRSKGSSRKTSLDTLRLDGSRQLPALAAIIRDEGRTFRISGFLFDQSGRGAAREAFDLGSLSVAQGQEVSSSIDFASFELTYGVRAAEVVFPSENPARGVSMAVDVYAGLRAYDMKFEVESGGASVRDDNRWVDLVVGARTETEITDEFSFDLAVDLGAFVMGDRASSSVGVLTGFHWRPNQRTGVQLGYRFLASNFEDGDDDERFSFSGSIAGLFLSAVLRF